jgi:hypothetical protein
MVGLPRYHFHIENGPSEDQSLDFADDTLAIAEGLRTAAGLVSDLSLAQIGTETHYVDVSGEDGVPVLRVEIRAVRSR